MLITPVIIALTTVCFTWLIIFFRRRYNKLPPGPWGLPFFGYYPFLSRKPYLDFDELSKRYGKVFSFRTVGGKLIVVLNGLETIKEVLVNRSDEFIGRPEEYNLIQWISDGLGIAQEEGQPWKEHRRFFLQTAKNFGFGKQESEDLIHEEIKTMIKDIKKDGDRPSDFKYHVAYAVNSVICQILFSKKFEKYGGQFEDITKCASDLVEIFADQRLMLVGPFYQHVVMKLLPSTAKVRKAKKVYRKLANEVLDYHAKTYDPENLRDYVDSYFHQANNLDKSGEKNHSFTRERLSSISMNMIMEGTESVGSAIWGLLDYASHYPQEQKMVQEELDSIVGRERLPSMTDRPKLPYLEAFIQELYRHSMPFKISTHYCNFEETMIQGFRIPKRTIIVANLWSVSTDPALYPEPSKFDPKRFVDENGKKVKTDGPYPFGVGKRACIGEALAQVEVFLLIASVLQNFTLYPTEEVGFLKAELRQ